MKDASETLESLLKEKRSFSPPKLFSAAAHVPDLKSYQALHTKALKNPDAFWAEQAKALHWFHPWEKTLVWDAPNAKWFTKGKLNVSYNCLDRHLKTQPHKTAILWEGEPGEVRKLSYQDLYTEVATFAACLQTLGLKKADRVILYMPMIPELAIAMLACSRIGLIHSVIFGGFSAQAIRDRVEDSKAKLIITADGGYRRGKIVELKRNVDQAIQNTSSVEHVIVYQRTKHEIPFHPKKDFWWHELTAKNKNLADALPLDSEDPLFILYTSGTTGKPKGILHTTAGYLLQAHVSTKWVFDLKDDDIYWCTADIGWITGHTYIVYGPLSNGATTLMYEGAPNHPHPGRFWEIIDRHKVSIFYTSPTALRAFIQWGEKIPHEYALSTLRLLGTVGEPINPETWMWYYSVIGKEKCPIVDTWWQTETGSIMISPLPGATPLKPGSATLPLPGIDAEVVDGKGNPVPPNTGGFLVIRNPWPSMLRTIYNDHDRYSEHYWKKFPGMYWTGDEARRDEEGYFWILGRADDVIKVSGHRLGTSEIESSVVSHPSVAECAVVGIPHKIKGECIVAFATLKQGHVPSPEMAQTLINHVAKEIGTIARPEEIRLVPRLPKTRSGKIMRRLLRKIAAKEEIVGDTTTLEDPSIIEELSKSMA